MNFGGRQRSTRSAGLASSGSRPGAVRQLVYSPRRNHNTSSFYSRPQPLQIRDENYQPNFDRYQNSPEIPMQNDGWQPGQTLPISICSSQQNASVSLQSIVQELQGTIERNFDQFNQRFDSLEDRVASIEDKCKRFDTLHSTPPSSSSASESPSGMIRNRRSPPELQHEIRRIHAAFREENQLNLDERIDSDHNKMVISKLVEELGTTKFTSKQIRVKGLTKEVGYHVGDPKNILITRDRYSALQDDGAKIYRKTLKDSRNGRSDAVQHRVRIRSRQQRLFERRAKVVKARESMAWKLITPDMMSEEEDEGEEFIRHRPNWRSTSLNRFIDKLELRFKTTNPQSLARSRSYGDPVIKSAPSGIPSWMVQATENVDPASMPNLSDEEDQD